MKRLTAALALGVFVLGVTAVGCSKSNDAATTTTVAAAASSGNNSNNNSNNNASSGPVDTISLEACVNFALANLDFTTAKDGAAAKAAAEKMKGFAKPPSDVEAAMQVVIDTNGIPDPTKGDVAAAEKWGKASTTVTDWVGKVCPSK